MAKKVAAKLEMKKIKVELDGIAEIMFDRFTDHGKAEKTAMDRFHLHEKKGLMIPGDYIESFFIRENKPPGCIKCVEGKSCGEFLKTAQGHLFIDESVLPFLENGKPIIFKGFGKNGSSKFYINDWSAGITKASTGTNMIKQPPKKRPVMRPPWQLAFTLSLIKNELIDEERVYNWLVAGGMRVGIGTWRPRYGRFRVSKYEF